MDSDRRDEEMGRVGSESDVRSRDRSDDASGFERAEIERRAYRRFEERGGTHGNDQEDWFEAERELRERGRREQRDTRRSRANDAGAAGRGGPTESGR